MMIELMIEGTDNDGAAAAGGTIFLERQNGSSWDVIRAVGYAVYKYTTVTYSFIWPDSATGSSQTYRIRLGSGQQVDFHLKGVTGYIFGLR